MCLTALTDLRTGKKHSGTHHETFPMRDEQAEAVEKTFDYYQSIWAENKKAVPRFLWNAKMRFGKTFTTSDQLAKEARCEAQPVGLGRGVTLGKRDWKTTRTLMAGNTSHATRATPQPIFRRRSRWCISACFRILLGRDPTGNIKAKNEWLHTVN